MANTITRLSTKTSGLEAFEKTEELGRRRDLTAEEAWEIQKSQYCRVKEVCQTYITAMSQGFRLPNSCRICEGVKFREACVLYKLSTV